jgi:5-formyltetrahydrofolate cyclo-ligase
MDALDLAKRELRDRMRELRRSLSQHHRTEASALVCARLAELPELERARGLLAYTATSEEADPAAAVESLRTAGVRVAMPRVAGPHTLELHWVEEPAELVTGAYGILEPSRHAARAEPAAIDAALVPGVAFDANGRRLGFGGGYYDVLLPKLREDALVVGIALDEQIAGEVPTGDDDATVDVVVTPSGLLRAR